MRCPERTGKNSAGDHRKLEGKRSRKEWNGHELDQR
jgi:hypothetical protein